jgi:Rrf2 family protein
LRAPRQDQIAPSKTKLDQVALDFWPQGVLLAPDAFGAAGFAPPPVSRTDRVLTKKGKYGLKAMVHLAGLAPDALAQAADIAETNSISKKFLDHILTELRHAGLIYSKKGKGGGYALARPAHEIRIGAIVRALDGPLAPIACASVTAYRPCDDCADLKSCPVRLIMVAARDAIASVLDQRTLAEMRALSPGSELALMYNI